MSDDDDREPTRQEQREAREIARDIYRGITEEGHGGPRTMQSLKAAMAEAHMDFSALDHSSARSGRSNEEIEAGLTAQIHDNAIENVRETYARLQAGDMGSHGRRSNVEKIVAHIEFLGGDYGVLDAAGVRPSAEMRTEFEEAARAASIARATSDLDRLESGRTNLVDGMVRFATLGALDGRDSRIQSIGRDLQRAGINADTNNDRRYDHAEVAAALGREMPPERTAMPSLGDLVVPRTPAEALPEPTSGIKR